MHKRRKQHYVIRIPKPKLSRQWLARVVMEWAIKKFLDLLLNLVKYLFEGGT
jgi:hypothetical protein